MAEYTVVNLKEIENPAARFGMSPDDIHLATGRRPLGTETAGVTYLRLAPGYRAPFGHRHAAQEEVYVLVNGSARMRIGDETVELEPFTAVRVSAGTMRGYEGGPDGAELIVVGAPDPGPEGDVEIVPGWWAD